MYSLQDQECAATLAQLSKYTESKNTISKNITTVDNFETTVVNKLNEFTSPWMMKWKSKCVYDICDDYDNIIEINFWTNVKWPMHHIIPFDLPLKLEQLIVKTSWYEKFNACVVENIVGYYDHKSSEFGFKCKGAFGLYDMEKCMNCGFVWDGYAQCMCYLNSEEASA